MDCNRPVRALSALAMLGFADVGAGQTIADYSRAQAAALQRSMVQAIGRPLAEAPMATSPTNTGLHRESWMETTPAMPSQPAAAQPRAWVEKSPRHGESAIALTGVFASSERSVAEVTVEGVSCWVSVGDSVPGTKWVLHRISSEGVELRSRGGLHGPSGGAVGLASRTLLLPGAK
jgi:type IV pilus biogenesis protein PilP